METIYRGRKNSILKAYKENNQINQAGSAISFIEKLEHDRKDLLLYL
ncbi:hypothetical protein [Ferroplasma sp.]|nr:hypothetical protein [Ferroplasma sp.]